MGFHKCFVLVDSSHSTLYSSHWYLFPHCIFASGFPFFYAALSFSDTPLEHTFASVTWASLQFPGHVNYPCLPTPEYTFIGLGSVHEMEHTTFVCISFLKIVVLLPEYTFTWLGSIYETEQTTFICIFPVQNNLYFLLQSSSRVASIFLQILQCRFFRQLNKIPCCTRATFSLLIHLLMATWADFISLLLWKQSQQT